ncbi:MAG: DUF11 domain-containing protein [Chloroflexi bacterium]|nr:DUF11 domain-containing protein [Chloroflexota bacterium]
MKKLNRCAGISKIAPMFLAVTIGVMLALTVVLAQAAANFDSSYKTGPSFAEMGDVITYTIVAVNSGDSVSGVVLSDTVPFGTTFIPGSCTYITQTGSAQVCGPLTSMWQEYFATGGRITTTLAVQVTAGTMGWSLENCAYLSWDSSQKEMCFTTTANPAGVYLPLIMRNFTPMPDLRVASLTVAPSNPTAGQPVTIMVTVENVGETAAGPFWVDLYDNPAPPPTEANQIWNFVCSGTLADCYGIAWYVADGLGAGESVVLTSLSGYEAPQTHWLGYFVQSGGHDLYAFADSWNWTVLWGAVEERNEGLDNRFGPVSINVGIVVGSEAIPSLEEAPYIPWRPNQP